MNARKLEQGLMTKVCDALDVSIGAGTSLVEDAHEILSAYNTKLPSYSHKLSVVQYGKEFSGVDFDADRSCWYNTGGQYGTQATFIDAVLDAVAVRLNLIPSARKEAQSKTEHSDEK